MKKVVIVGGGFAGTTIAKKLQRYFDTTLIDTKSYFEFTPSILTILRSKKRMTKIRIEHTSYLLHSKIVVGTVHSVTKNAVFVGKQKLEYDFLIIATGWKYGYLPIQIPYHSITKLETQLDAVAHSNSVLVIGGGPVGIELAAELVEQKKIVALVNKGTLLSRLDPKASIHAKKFLESKGVRIILDEAVTEYANGYLTDKGSSIHADTAFLCTGCVPNSLFMKKTYARSLTDQGFIKVNKYFQVKNTKTIFAVGDITTISEEKSAQNAEAQAAVVAKNLLRLASGKKLISYSPKVRPLAISLGSKNGILAYKSFVWSGFIPGLLKYVIEYKTIWKYKYL